MIARERFRGLLITSQEVVLELGFQLLTALSIRLPVCTLIPPKCPRRATVKVKLYVSEECMSAHLAMIQT